MFDEPYFTVIGAAHDAWRITSEAMEIWYRSPLWHYTEGEIPNTFQLDLVKEELDG